MTNNQITYKRTAIGWFNVTLVETGAIINVSPVVFYEATEASNRTKTGCTELTNEQYRRIMSDRWTRVISMDDVKRTI
ncbi:hypothetical protein [Sporosarcina aquimarina]|uniref:Uncharacterized protein n=1 Tax=Sporosarcina aquimarina TaxID=114975 RepID=A0ABU4G0N2_9BACL|nr:hypothetical protein [Sporosarcina aquimarina]MDW0110441.1 hypothetical protein [Sporosarcina aquimarina]